MAALYCQGTILGVEEDRFDPMGAAQTLRKAIKGFGTDEEAIIRVLSRHSNRQRQVIKDTYKTSFGRDLIEDLKADLAGNFLRLCLYLMLPQEEYDARCLRYALQHGQSETLVDILSTRSNFQIQEIRPKYKELHKRELDEDIEDHVPGDFKRVLVGLAQGRRSEEQVVDQQKVDVDVQQLYKAGVARLGTDEDVFTMILVSRSVPHLCAVFQAYQDKYGQQMESVIEDEMSGDTKRAFLAIVQCVRDPVTHFAQCFNEAFKGPGTDDERLIQLIVSRSEVDLLDVADRYEVLYKQTLRDAIKSEASGDYRKLLLKILGPSEEE